MRNLLDRLRPRVTLFVFVAVVSLLVCTGARAELLPGQSVGKLKAEAAAFSEGGGVDLGRYGKPYALCFFVPNGKAESEQMPALQNLLEKKNFKKYDFIAVTRGKDPDEKKSAADFLKAAGIKAKLVFDPKLEIAERFGVAEIPRFFIVDGKGVLRTLGMESVTEPARRRSFEDFLSMTDKGETIPFVDFFSTKNEAQKSLALIGKPAPDFELTDFKKNKYRLSDYKGKNVILVYWKISCPHCLKELPRLQSFYLNYREKYDLEVIAVARPADSGERAKMKDVISSNMLTFPALVDDGDKVALKYGVTLVPAAFFINKKGAVVEHIVGGNENFGLVYSSIFRDPLRFGMK